MTNTFESYALLLLRRKERYKAKLLADKDLYGDAFQTLYDKTVAQIDVLYMLIAGHSSVVNPYADSYGQPLKDKKDEFKEWNDEFEKKSKLTY